jgi:hypothetical protein
MAYQSLWGHGERYLGGGGGQVISSITLSYMTTVDRWDVQQAGEAPIFLGTSHPGVIGSMGIDHFVNVNSSVGKASKTGTFTGCIGASFSGGVCSGAGSTSF